MLLWHLDDDKQQDKQQQQQQQKEQQQLARAADAAAAAQAAYATTTTQQRRKVSPADVPAAISLTSGCVAGFLTATVTYPLDVVRRRMQVEGQGRAGALPSYGQVIRRILATRGPVGCYTGLLAEYCKVVPGVAIAYGSYEAMKSLTEAD